MEIKQLSPRLAGEWFVIPNTTVSRHVAKKYANVGTVGPAVGAVLGERRQKNIVWSCQLLPQQSLELQHADTYRYLCIILTVLSTLYTFILLHASSKPSMSGRKCF